MPEGPEIRRMVDDIAATVAARPAARVHFAFARLKPMETTLAGRRVTSVEARGKAVLVFFAARDDDGPWCVYSHNQLYGQWRIGTADRAPETRRQLRFAIVAGERAARLYSASDIRVLRPDALASVPYLARLGPDPLNETVGDAALTAQLTEPRFAGRALGGLLLDQAFVAGIGNYLRSEILFLAGVHPKRTPATLTSTERAHLVAAIRTLIERAYRLKGITNDPERARRLADAGHSLSARRHMVFGRAGQPCPVCKGVIEKQRVASRRLYLCPTCQPATPPAGT
ncbi:endoribonuclease SymE [Salinisphaera orenii MK-B5]|uniref:DNA-(apurinic or apyrimidinic site) lyase n=1 Tax=Salinisphaera orenii MK-B5 TaxID=856730 RepID=A0A423PVZ5_9GAMM|nr:endonuclease VIII [Salinisphaera orenii]ROO29745.1 endoribonuclease SymE [Salinisphaera orenii MK-B5]